MGPPPEAAGVTTRDKTHFAGLNRYARSDLKALFLKLAEAMGDNQEEQKRAHKVMNTLVQTKADDIAQGRAEANHIRLPQTPQDWVELESVAPKGPSAIYGWALGENSVMARKAESLTWADIGATDPIAECHKIVDSLKIMQEVESRR